MRGGVSFAGVLGAVGGAGRRRTGTTFTGLLAAGVPGAYFGAVVAGLLAVVTEPLRDPAAMAGLAVLGTVGGCLVAILTRWAPAVHRRVAVFTVGGLVSFPLAVSIGQLQHPWAEVGIGFIAAGWLIRAGHYVSAAWRGRVRRPAAGLAVRVR
jgi:hypothetical protein